MTLLEPWQSFVLANGYRANASDLAAVISRPEAEIQQLRAHGACKRLAKSHGFAELFSLWHGRAPKDSEWPAPRKGGGGYTWQPNELALLSTLVGQMGPAEIAEVLTTRLREKTGDKRAERNRASVLVQMQRLGLQTADIVGGLTVPQAAREIGSSAIVYQAIEKGHLSARKVGRLLLIPYKHWQDWKAKRTFPPEGFVLLASFKEPLAIRSDKLSEFARMGYVPGAVRCNPYGTKGKSTQFGTWWIDPKVGKQMVADRRAGKPMPWHGKPNPDNLRTTYRLWAQRKHPLACQTCQGIWGAKGAPASFEDYALRYPPLDHGAKRHLTRVWTPGLTVSDVAEQSGRVRAHVLRAIASGTLAATEIDGTVYVTQTDATRWIARHSPSGEGEKSWLALETACTLHLFTLAELRGHIAEGRLLSKVGTDGAMRGIEYVSRQQCRELRERIGFTEQEAARRAGVTVERLRVLLEGLDWRGKATREAQAQAEPRIPLNTLQAVIKRLESREGYTLEEAADVIGAPLSWVKGCKTSGLIKVQQAKWDRRRVYITLPMLERLRSAWFMPPPAKAQQLGEEWLTSGEAALEAGVSQATLLRWVDASDLRTRRDTMGWTRYHRVDVRARALRYWTTEVRYVRKTPPEWMRLERQGAAVVNA